MSKSKKHNPLEGVTAVTATGILDGVLLTKEDRKAGRVHIHFESEATCEEHVMRISYADAAALITGLTNYLDGLPVPATRRSKSRSKSV